MRAPIDPAVVVAGLRALADEIESGYRPVPQPGQGMRRVNGATVVPLVVHDALCGWRVASAQDDVEPPTLVCAGCGLGYLHDEARGQR